MSDLRTFIGMWKRAIFTSALSIAPKIYGYLNDKVVMKAYYDYFFRVDALQTLIRSESALFFKTFLQMLMGL